MARCRSLSLDWVASRNRPEPKNYNPDWVGIRNVTDDACDLYIYDEISFWGIEAMDVVREVAGMDVGTINLHVNSPGGLVFDGIAIYNVLRNHSARVVTHIDGLAASIASVIALAGDEVRIASNAMMMIHDPWTFAIGNSRDLREEADVLDQVAETILTTYTDKSDTDREELQQLMADETWLNAQESLELGLVDQIGQGDSGAEDKVARFDLSKFAYSNVPAAFARHEEPPKPSGKSASLLLQSLDLREKTFGPAGAAA